MQIETIKITDLKPHPGNPRLHPDNAIERLTKSIKEFGWTNPILVSEDNFILAGHARLKAAEKAKLKKIPIIRLPLSGDKALAYMIADNKLQDMTEWDYPKLKDLLVELDTGVLDMELTGFDIDELKDLIDYESKGDIDEGPEPQIDKADELQKKWKTKLGQVWEIGKHRLMCGDSTNAEDVKRLMGGEKAAVISDPPYGVSIVGKNGTVGGENICAVGVYSPVAGDETIEKAKVFYQLCIELGFMSFGLWGGNYFTDFLPPSSCWFVWDKRGKITSNNFADCELMWTSLDKPARLFKQVWMGMIKEGEHGKRIHPTQKPVNTVQESIKLFDEDIIFDGFLGSGTTMVAAEQLSRICYGMEIEPKYCAVTLQRMADMGLKPKKVTS